MSCHSDLELLDMIVNSDSDNEYYNLVRQFTAILPDMEVETSILQRERGETSSQRKRRPRRVVERDREGADALLIQHYFNDSPVYLDNQFERRYRMSKNMFERIVNDINNFGGDPLPDHFKWFRVGRDVANRAPISIYQKCTAAIRQLAYGFTPDATDEYLQMGETTAAKSLQNFCKCVYDLYKDVYLRKPTTEDIERLYEKHNEVHGLPGMLGSIDCMHWAWKNCPTAWKGSNNDINVLHQSTFFHDLINDTATPSKFKVRGNEYDFGYYLADGIYPEWAAFVKSYSAPQDDKKRKFKGFKKVQEKMLNVHSVCFRVNGKSSSIQQKRGAKTN